EWMRKPTQVIGTVQKSDLHSWAEIWETSRRQARTTRREPMRLSYRLRRNYMLSLFVLASILSSNPGRADISTSEARRIGEAATVLKEIHGVPDKDIPQELWNKAACVIVVPGLKKAAFVFGGEYGKGLMSCRRNGAWSAPIFMQIGKGSWGLQIGAQSIDLVLLVMNKSGVEKLMVNKVTLGAEASVGGGTVVRDARDGTDVQLKDEIRSCS